VSAFDDYLAGSKQAPSSVGGPQGMAKAAVDQASAFDEYLGKAGGSFTDAQRQSQTGMPSTDFRSWYTGQNLGAVPGVTESGTQNGWDTQFQQTFQDQYNRALEKGDVFNMFAQDDAVGVVTWDNAAGRRGKKFEFGDIVVEGEKVGNVYEDFDRHTANVMMGDYVLETGARKAELNEESDREKAWDEEINRLRSENNQRAETAPRAAAYEAGIREELETDPDRGKIVAGGALGTAALAAGAGFVAGGPVGALFAGAGGLVVGGLGAWLNNDSLAYQLAASQERHEMATKEGAGISSWMAMAAENTMSIGMNPLQNMVQGSYDYLYDNGPTGGSLGGGFRAEDAEGNRKAGLGWQAADLAAMLGDSALQLASPVGKSAYQAQMSTQIGSGLLEILPGGPGAWDSTLLRQNSVWTREEFNPETGRWEEQFDFGNALAGIGNVGIDVVQLGAWSSLSRQTDRLANRVARKTGQEPSKWARPFNGDRFLERINLDSVQRAALKSGKAQIETQSGLKFVVSDTGEIIGKERRGLIARAANLEGTQARATLAMLAPSEGLQALTAKVLARRDAAVKGGAVTSEQLYQAAADLAMGQRGMIAVLVNAVGEAQEEVAQGFLEPWSQDHSVNAEDLIRSGLAGAVSGAGMTFGSRLGRPSQDLQMFQVARMGWAQQTGGEQLTFKQWQEMDHLQKRTLVKAAGAVSKALTDGAYEKIERDRVEGIVGGVVEAAAWEDYVRAEDELALDKGAVATDQAAPIVMHESYTFRPEALATSHTQLLQNQEDRTRGGAKQLSEVNKEIARVKGAVSSDPQNAELAKELARLEVQRDTLSAVVEQSRRLEETLRLYVDAIDAEFDDNRPDLAEQMIDGLNRDLEALFDMSTDQVELAVDGRLRTVTLTSDEVFAMSQAVSRLATRDPADSTGSWQVMLPQVHKVFSYRKADGVYGVSQIILKAIRGDYDGDKMRELQQVILDEADYRNIRSGANVLGAGAMPEIDSTKFERAITVRAMQAWDSSNTPMRQAARQISMAIEAELINRYHNDATGMKPIGVDVIADVTEKVNEALATGGDVREAVLETMSRRAGGALQEIGRGRYWAPGQPKLSNEMYWMANMVTKHMQQFQSWYAEHTPNKGVPDDSFQVVAPSQAVADVSARTPVSGATPGHTSMQELPGSNMFRMFQKLHYTLWETTAKFAGWAKDAGDIRYQELVQHYERLSQGKIDQRLERKSPSDQIIGQVLAWLEQSASDPTELDRLGLSELGDMALMANVGVGQMRYKEDENGERHLYYTGEQVTLGQHLLYLSLEKFKRQHSAVWEQDPNLRSTFASLSQLTKPAKQGHARGSAEMAFVKIFESTRLFDLVGADAVELGVNRTVGQYYRELRALSPEERSAAKHQARSGVYADAEPGFTIPFGSAELEARSVNTYKSLVDSVFSAADSSLSMNRTGKDKGKATGRDADRNTKHSEAIHEAYHAVGALLRRLMPKTGPYTAEDVSRLANENPQFGAALMKAIPKETMPWVMKRQNPDGTVVFAKWFYEVWIQESAEQAEMSYYRNFLLDSWYAKKRTLDIDFANGDGVEEKKIAFDSLQYRMHRVMFRLASRSSGETADYEPYAMHQFLTKLNEAQDLETFMRWVRTEPGLALEGAPILPWVDDVAEFDPDKVGGGWSSQLSMPTLMENVNDLKAAAHRLIKDTDKAAERSKSDVQTARAIERWHKHLKDPGNQDLLAATRNGDKEKYEQFVELLKNSAKRRMVNGPRAMLQHTAHLVFGMYAPAHAKGAIADQMAANAVLEQMDNAIGFLTPGERVLGYLTTHNEDAVADAPHMLLRDGGRLMDRHGAIVSWELNSVEAMLPLMTDPKNHNLMRAALFDTVVELDTDGAARRKFLMGTTLEEVLSGRTVKDLFNIEGRNPKLTESMQFIAKMEAELRDTEKHQLEQKVTELVIARTTALDHTADFEEIQSMTVQAYMDMAAVMQTVGRTQTRPGEPDPVHLAFAKLSKAAKVDAIAKARGIDPKYIAGDMAKLQDIIVDQIVAPISTRIDRLYEMARDPKRSRTEVDELIERAEREERTRELEEKRIKQMFDLNITDAIVNEYTYDPEASAAEKHAQQEHLMQYVYERGEIMQAAGPALMTVQAIKNHMGETPQNRIADPLKLPDKDWETLASVIISVEIQRVLTVGPASNPPPPYPAALKPGVKGLDTRKYWDSSFSYLFDFLSDKDSSGIVAAARRLAVEGGMLQAQFTADDVTDTVVNNIMREGSLGTWTAEVPIQSIESWELLTGASAKPAISMHGLISQRWGAAMEATQRQTTKTTADSTVKLTARDLDWMNTGRFHDVTVTRDDGRTFQRPLAQMNNRFASELSFTYGSATTPVDLMKRPNVARLWLPAEGEKGGTDFREVNIDRLAAEIQLALREMYPDAAEEELSKMLAAVEVTMKFVNPDSQPSSAEHANSVWHEGTVYDSAGDTGRSLLRAFFYGIGALNARGQQAALDTRKLGLMGIEDFDRPAFAEVDKIERENKGTDFARMIALKTNILMDTKISQGKPIDVTFYNAAYKLMKLKHWVEGVDKATGERTRWSAEQVIEWQMKPENYDPVTKTSKDFFGPEGPLRGAKLWIPSDKVLADMMGDIGYGGVEGRALRTEQTDNLQTIPLYESKWTERMSEKFSLDVKPATLLDTDVAKQSYVQDVKVSSKVTPQERMRFQRRVEAMERKFSQALDDRLKAVQRKTFDVNKNRAANKEIATNWIVASDVSLPGLPPEMRYLEREHGDVRTNTLVAMDRYLEEQRGRGADNGSAFWIFQETGTASIDEGRLTKGELTGKLSLVPGEIVLFDTAAYKGMDPDVARKKAMERVDYFVSRGVALMFESSDGPRSLTSDLQQLTMSRYGYQRYLNNTSILVPDVFDQAAFQNVAAARARLVAPSGVRVNRQRLSLLFTDQQVEENTMWVPVRPGVKTRFESIQAIFDLLPIDAYAKFNSANTADDAQKVQNYIEGLGDLTSPGVNMLRKEALGDLKGAERDQAETEFNEAWKRMKAALPRRVAANTTLPLENEEFGTGDFIPLLDSRTNELMLYRHGYDHPKKKDYQRQLRQQVPGSPGMRGVVMYSGKRKPTATTHRGTVVAVHESPGRGFRLELEVPVQTLGGKITYEHNGMKYLQKDLPSDVAIPSIALFGDLEIDGFASLHDVVSKEATDGLVTSFQNAFTVFGIDFTEDIKDFFGTKTTDEAIVLLKKIARHMPKKSVDEVYRMQSLLAGQDSFFSAVSGLLPQLAGAGIDTKPWAPRLEESSATAAIGRAMLVYLASPGADVNAIIKSSGFYVDRPSMEGAQSQKMPELFTRAFDLAKPDSAIKKELSDRINDGVLNKSASESWHLDVNSWELEGVTRSGKTIRGVLQYGEAYATEDNPLLNLMAQERKDSQSATRHQALMNRIGTGGITMTKGEKLRQLSALRAHDLTDPEQIDSMWHDLTYVDPTTHGPGSRWQARTQGEHVFYAQSMQRYTQYRKAIDFDDKMYDDDRRDIENAITRVVDRLGLRPSQSEMVHYWIRQMLYRPAEGPDQDAFLGALNPSDVLGALKAIHDNLDEGYYPTYDSAGPSFFSYDDLLVLFNQYSRGTSKWAPVRHEGNSRSKAGKDDIGEWIGIAFGQAFSSEVKFDPVARLDLAGHMNTYQTVLRNSGYMMDITFDKEYQRKLLDPKTNELLTVTLDPVENTRLTEQVLLATQGLEYEDLMRGSIRGSDDLTRGINANWRQRRLDAVAKWRARRKVRPVKQQSVRDFYRNGMEVINKDADMHSLQRIVIALRHGMAMLNPGLYVSMIPEQGFRMYISEATNFLTGESTLRSVSALQRGVNKATGGRIQFAQYSRDQINNMNELFQNMGNDGAFTSLIIKDMMWQKDRNSPGKIVDAFERFAAVGNLWQDPTWGTTQKSLARHYVEAVLRAIESQPTRNVMTIDSVIAHLRTDPTYFAREMPEIHRMASNFVVDFRSLKQTPLSLAMRAIYEPWATSGNGLKRFAGTLIKLQAMYATYNMNVLTTITGMQGYSDMLATYLDGRRTAGTLMNRMWKAATGQQITDEDNRTYDMSSTIDGVTLANAFIRGGVTQTGLFMLGAAAGGILSGEDDEMKRRRRLAEAQNAPLIMDPRRLEADFRNKDVIFLDWLPFDLSAFFRVSGDDGSQGARAAAQMSWILKPFLSPIIGMERFFMTGDFDYVTAGFADAVGSMPLFNKNKWDDAARTANELAALAAEEDQAATPTATKNALYLLTSAVGVYESMLVENMFVNSLYTGWDQYDRDPTKLVLRDSDGVLQRTIEGDARKNDLSMTQVPGEDGNIETPYIRRDPMMANLAAYSENNFTAAAIMSLFKPIHHQEFFRGDMPVRERTIKMPELTSDEAKLAVVLATVRGQMDAGTLERRLSLDEVTRMLKDDILEREDWDAFHNLDAIALKFYNSDANPINDPLSYVGPDGQELLTKSGHAALFKGLMGGTITLDSPEMQGIAITREQRLELEKDFYEDMVREGKDIGLTQTQAEFRATRLMVGPRDDSSVKGFKEILWDTRIPWTPDAKYKQLNTTFVQGPDGFPWATGYRRGARPGNGIWQMLGGVKRANLGSSVTDAVGEGGRMNSQDLVREINTGQRGLVPMNASELIPTDWEQTQEIIDAIKDHDVNVGNSYEPNSNGGGSGTFYRGGYRYGGGSGGYSSGRSYSPTIYWSRQATLPRGTNIYGNTARNLFWDNGLIRRTTIRRERYQSSRERLKQWQ